LAAEKNEIHTPQNLCFKFFLGNSPELWTLGGYFNQQAITEALARPIGHFERPLEHSKAPGRRWIK
jgi:hypothetical protein